MSLPYPSEGKRSRPGAFYSLTIPLLLSTQCLHKQKGVSQKLSNSSLLVSRTGIEPVTT